MSGAGVRRAQRVLVLAVAVVPWAVASPGGLGGADASPGGRESSAAIESLTSLLVVTADRPTVSVTLKRTEGARVLGAVTAGRSNVHLLLGLVHAPWPAFPIERSRPLALHLAGRGPPLALAA